MSTKIDKDAIGIEVSWSFGDGDAEAVTLPRDLVRNALMHHGFKGELIENPSEDTVLRTALQTVKGRSKEIVVQELRRPRKDTPRAVGVYQVQAKEGESGDNMVCGARVRIEAGRIVALPPEGGDVIYACMAVASDLARMANSLLDNCVNRDISNALVDIGWGSAWITRRRNSGGVYFIPAGDRAERFLALLKALEVATSHELRTRQFVPQVMEVYPKPLTMSMWSASARDQYDAQVADLVVELRKMEADGTMRESTVQKRADECDRLMQQAETHRMFLNEHAEIISSELARVKAKFKQRLEQAQEARGEIDQVFTALDKADAQARRNKRAGAKAKAPVAQQVLPSEPERELTDEELFDV
jgi:hypothetical protein